MRRQPGPERAQGGAVAPQQTQQAAAASVDLGAREAPQQAAASSTGSARHTRGTRAVDIVESIESWSEYTKAAFLFFGTVSQSVTALD